MAVRDEFIVCLPFGLDFKLAAGLEDLIDFDDFDDLEPFAYNH
jgi:hypothetical protein